MTFNSIFHFIAAGCCLGAAFFALVRDRRSFVHRIFALGMVILALESFFNGLSIQAIFPEAAISWQHWRFYLGWSGYGFYLVLKNLVLSRKSGQARPSGPGYLLFLPLAS